MENNYSETLAKTFSDALDKTNSFKKKFNSVPFHRVANAVKTISAVNGSYIYIPFCYQQFNLRQNRISGGGKPIVYFDAADDCHIYVTTMKGMNFQYDILSISIVNFKDHRVLISDVTSMQDATESF